jgi:hypothetical protein
VQDGRKTNPGARREIVMACDLCGKSCAPYDLVCLLDSYKTRGIEWICPDCEKEVNAVLEKMKLAAHGWYSRMFKIFLRTRKIKYTKERGE